MPSQLTVYLLVYFVFLHKRFIMHTITIHTTNNPAILKFESNNFLVKNQNFEFNNIDEAKPSPLAQQLFYLPFVKKVYISGNFIAIERYNIVEWADVQDEVAKQIENYLNENGVVVTEAAVPKKVPVTVYAESTPNPTVMKFVANKKMATRPFEFATIEEAKNSPLATKLFHFPFVKSVFIDENFVSITKYDIADWNDITMELREFVRQFIETGSTVVDEEAEAITNQAKSSNSSPAIDLESLDDVSQQVISILDEYIKPAVASDGGNIQFKSYNPENKTVEVILQGACSGCPSSTMTLKNGIETMLREMLNGSVTSVVAHNG